MDPKVALANLRDAMKRLADYEAGLFPRPDLDEAIADATEAWEALDGWLSKGGFLPDAWARERVEDSDEDPTIRCRDCEHPLHQRAEKALSGETAIVWADQHDVWVCDETGNEHRPGVRA